VKRATRQFGLLIIAVSCALAGCRWNTLFRRTYSEPPPIAFSALPGPTEAVTAVNANTERIHSLQAQGAKISIPGAPAISTEIAIERPQRLRLRAGTQLLGPELDLGSNDQLFWLWAARMPNPSVYFARHDQFSTSRARQMLGIEPAWLIEALGLVQIDPASVIDGPHMAGGDRIELRTTLNTAGGPFTRLLVLHHRYAWVLEQHVYDEKGQLIASARNSEHDYNPVDGVSLPRKTEVQIPQGMLRLQLDVDRWAVNQPLSENQTLFELPRSQLGSHAFVDLADPGFVPPQATIPASQPATNAAQTSSNDSRQAVRGLSKRR
jgi:hypothetical protein